MKVWQVLILILAVSLLTACSTNPDFPLQPTPTLTTVSQTFAPTQTPILETKPVNTATPLPAPTLTSAPALWIADYVPTAIAEYIRAEFGDQIQITEDQQFSNWQFGIGGEVILANWVYVLVAPFPTISDGVMASELKAAWQGELSTEPFANIPLRMDSPTYDVFAQYWGQAASGSVEIIASKNLLQTAWEQQPSWVLIPFENLEPQWKVLQIDGISPLQKEFNPSNYPLAVNFGLNADPGKSLPPLSNWDAAKMTDIMLTGVTALVRGTALTMERKGITHPGEDIAPLTTQVDFMHVNNEIPFTPDCPFPELYLEKLVFCSDMRYAELLEFIGTDFVEVSGDHFGDHGPEGTLFTLDLYDEIGWPFYGGGRNLEDGRQPLLLKHNGNKIAILGCNAKGSQYYAPADENTPGAVPCDFDWMEGEIARLKAEGFLVIVTLQHIEYYSYEAQPDLVRDFGRMAEAGAVIVSGSQSHQAHGFAFENEALIHYGLGNLFFDQYLFCEEAACDYGFMDRHIIYAGRHISTELIPIRFIDMARPRLMTGKKRPGSSTSFFLPAGGENEQTGRGERA